MDKELAAGRKLVCHCFEMTAEEIQAEALRSGLKSAGEVIEHLRAGHGCTLCKSEVEALVRDAWRRKPSRAHRDAGGR